MVSAMKAKRLAEQPKYFSTSNSIFSTTVGQNVEIVSSRILFYEANSCFVL
jgi:hypothetical protein